MKQQEQADILMVDDQPGKLMTYEAILAPLGENLIQARSAREALNYLLHHDVAVVLMDVSMPEMDGFELADMMRQHPRFQKTAIIFISAVHLTDVDRIKGYRSGAVDYLSVPVIPELLRAKVGVFAELHRKGRQLERLNIELEQRVAERTEQLRQSEEQFRTLANSIPQLAFMAQDDGKIFWYNQRWYDFIGSQTEEIPTWGWRTVQHPGHAERVLKTLDAARKNGLPWEDTFPLRSSSGDYTWFLSRAVPLLDSGGKVARWFGTLTDVSAEIAAKEEIRNLNEQLEERVAELEAIMQVLPVGVAVLQDTTTGAITANAALGSLLGVDPVGNLWPRDADRRNSALTVYRDGQRVSPQDQPLLRAARIGQQLESVELEVRQPGKPSVHLLVSASPLFDAEGKARGSVGAYIDLTSRKQLEDLLSERADLLELATEAIIVRDMHDIVQYWNAGAEALYGWTREEIVGKSVHEVLRSRFPHGRGEAEASLAAHGTWNGDLTQYTKEGYELVVACRKAVNARGDAVLEISRDMTAQLKAEDALRKTERLAAMGRVAGIIAHEINNPLEAITNTFYLLRDHPSLDDEARQYAKLGEEELHRVAHITRQTLGFYRESKHPVAVSLPTLLDEILELQTRRMEFDKVLLEKRYNSAGTIHGFPVELKQVFLNLIGNAVQAMPEGGTLRLHVFSSHDRVTGREGVCVSISDTGTGIDPEHARHLFEPFFTTKSTKGTGLGLWISKGIVQKYGGSIRFRSFPAGDHKITCFQVFLPEADFDLQDVPEAAVLEPVGAAAAQGATHGR